MPEDRQQQGLGDSIPANIAGMRRRVGSPAAIKTAAPRRVRTDPGPDRGAFGCSDEGVILLRRLFKQSIEAVQNGQDPWASSEIRPKTKSFASCRASTNSIRRNSTLTHLGPDSSARQCSGRSFSDAKQQNGFYVHGETVGLKLKEELAKIVKQQGEFMDDMRRTKSPLKTAYDRFMESQVSRSWRAGTLPTCAKPSAVLEATGR